MEDKNRINEEKKFDRYGKVAKILFVLVLVVALIGVSYAIFRTVAYGEKSNELTVGDVGLVITNENTNGITLENAVPVTEEEGLTGNAYTFSLTNTGDYTMNYRLGFELSDDTTMPASSVRYVFTKGDETTGASAIMGSVSPEYIDGKYVYYVEAGQIAPDGTNNYSLMVWIDYNASLEANGMKFSVKARADGEAVSDTTEAWTLDNKQALRTPIDEQISTMHTKDLIDGAEYAYTLTESAQPIEYYIGQELGTVLIVPKDNTYYVYAFTKNSYGIEIGKWYQSDSSLEVFSLYEGASPITIGDYTSVYNEDYLNQIIESFND